MRKIMFNDRYGLTEAVLSGRKTQTRRIIPYLEDAVNIGHSRLEIYQGRELRCFTKDGDFIRFRIPYHIDEVVAVAQSYKDAGVDFIPEEDEEFGCYNFPAEQTHGWNNKLYVRSSLMSHQIRITNVRVERLNDISEADCKKEGIGRWMCQGKMYFGFFDYAKDIFVHRKTPREAYAALIDRIYGKGKWQSNPYVFVYDFELVK